MKRLTGLVLAAMALMAGCEKTPETTAPKTAIPAKPAASAPAAAPQTALAQPEAQTALVNLIRDAAAHSEDAAAFNRFCDAFQKTPAFDNWVVKVTDFRTSTVNQSIDITFSAGKPMSFEEVVQTSSPMYKALSGLYVGDTIRLSGHFVHAPTSAECTYYLSSFAIVVTDVH